MVPPSSNWYVLLDTIADSVNPLLAFAAIVVVAKEWRRSSRQSALLCGAATALGLLGIYVLRFFWRHWGGHYSTHAAFAVSVAISLAFWCPTRRALLAAVLAVYLPLVVIMGYHGLIEVLISSLVACAVTAPWQVAARASRAR